MRKISLFFSVLCLLMCMACSSNRGNEFFIPKAIWPDTDGNHINAHGVLHLSNLFRLLKCCQKLLNFGLLECLKLHNIFHQL